MALDPYQPCPCGSGKKIKFCCSKDIVPELDKVIRIVQGEQRIAALDHIDKLIADKGPRHALLAIKADVQIALGQLEDADATIDEFLTSSPDNPVALALSAIHACSQHDLEGAIEDLQQALEHIDEFFPQTVYHAIGVVAQTLLQSGDVVAARGHLLMQAGIAGSKDENPLRLLLRVNMLPEVPLLLKQDYQYAECPEGVAWSEEFQASNNLARRGAWIAACELLDALEEKYPGQAAILKNIAILSGWVGQRDEAVAAWRKYARLDCLPLDEAVEAEAFAQLLDTAADKDELERVTLTYSITDTDRLMEQLLSHPNVSRMPIDPAELSEEGVPPPKAVFWLLDKPIPTSSPDLTRDIIPRVVGELFVFGRRTDRPARLELVVLRDDEFMAHQNALLSVVGDLVEGDPVEEVLGSVSKVMATLAWRWRLPDNTPAEQRQALISEQQRDVLLNHWPNLKLKRFGGRTPLEAAADPAEKIAVLAAILLMELATDPGNSAFDFNELRAKMQLPTRDTLDPSNLDLMSLSLIEIPRVDVSKLTDEGLLVLYRRVTINHARNSIRLLAEEVLQRSSLKDKIDRNEAYELLIRTAATSEDALRYVAEAQKGAAERHESPAQWLLAELSIRIPRGEADECQRIVQRLQTRHMQEPGVGQGLYEVLLSHGVIAPDGAPVRGRRGAEPPRAASAPTAEPNRLWTPETAAAESGGGEKSKLWIPGMD